PQSPQLFKQLLMVSGYDRYFQIARCYRDEDFRTNRQPEFTQIDVEMSFVQPEDIYEVVEGSRRAIFRELRREALPTPIARISYADAMLRYGSDKPDLRFGLEIVDISNVPGLRDFKVFDGALESGGVIR